MMTFQPNDRWRSLYRRLLRCYPKSFQSEYAEPCLQLFDDLLREASPGERSQIIWRAYADTLMSIAAEQYNRLIETLTNRRPTMTTDQPSFLRRNRGKFITGTLILAIAVGVSFWAGFWSYAGPVARLQRIYQAGVSATKYESSSNVGYDDITANFVNDYIAAHYYGANRTDVGLASIHAEPNASTTQTISGRSYTFQTGLAYSLDQQYKSVTPGFDKITCSTIAPTSVSYVHSAGPTLPGTATMIAALTYPGSSAQNLVQYSLNLYLPKTGPSAWRVSDITCLSLEASGTLPYITKDAAQYPSSSIYSARNNRTFGLSETSMNTK